MLYVFVDIKIDTLHFVQTLQHNFMKGSHLAIVSTIQFVSTLQVLSATELIASYCVIRFVYFVLQSRIVV